MPDSHDNEGLVITCNKNKWSTPFDSRRAATVFKPREVDDGMKSSWHAVGSMPGFPLAVDTKLHALALFLMRARTKANESEIEGISISRVPISEYVIDDPDEHITAPCDPLHKLLRVATEEDRVAIAQLLGAGEHFSVWEYTTDELRAILKPLYDLNLLRPVYQPIALKILDSETTY